MSQRRPKPPTHREVVAANQKLLAVLGLEPKQGWIKHCWACKVFVGRPTRAHVLLHCLGGSSKPSNFFLLCDGCHKDQPDDAPREVQERWLQNHEDWQAAIFRRAQECHEWMEANLPRRYRKDLIWERFHWWVMQPEYVDQYGNKVPRWRAVYHERSSRRLSVDDVSFSTFKSLMAMLRQFVDSGECAKTEIPSNWDDWKHTNGVLVSLLGG